MLAGREDRAAAFPGIHTSRLGKHILTLLFPSVIELNAPLIGSYTELSLATNSVFEDSAPDR